MKVSQMSRMHNGSLVGESLKCPCCTYKAMLKAAHSVLDHREQRQVTKQVLKWSVSFQNVTLNHAQNYNRHFTDFVTHRQLQSKDLPPKEPFFSTYSKNTLSTGAHIPPCFMVTSDVCTISYCPQKRASPIYSFMRADIIQKESGRG